MIGILRRRLKSLRGRSRRKDFSMGLISITSIYPEMMSLAAGSQKHIVDDKGAVPETRPPPEATVGRATAIAATRVRIDLRKAAKGTEDQLQQVTEADKVVAAPIAKRGPQAPVDIQKTGEGRLLLGPLI
jgi:hypothetical protein